MNRSRSRRRTRRSTGGRPPIWAIAGVSLLAVVTLAVVVRIAFMTPESTEAAPTASYTPTMPAPTAPDVALFIGDSYTAGAGSTASNLRWTSQLALRAGWFESNEGVGGIGVVSDREGETYRTLATDTALVPADVVIVSGGRNDLRRDPAEVGLALDELLATLTTSHPDARVLMLSPWWDDDPAPDAFADIVDAYRSAAERAGIPYVETGQPLAERPDLLSEDGVHPNDAGHLALAEASHAAITAAGLLGD